VCGWIELPLLACAVAGPDISAVMQDLCNFREPTRPQVRNELRAGYPRHPWLDDPWTVTPTHWIKSRGARRTAG